MIWLLLVLQVFLAFGACFLPLVSGLSFERALAAGVILGPSATLISYRIFLRDPQAIYEKACTALSSSLLLGLPWLVMGLGYELIVQPCEPRTGLDFFIILPGANILSGTAVGGSIALLGFRKSWRLLPIPYIANLLYGLWLLYTEPPVWLYVSLLGFFPGPIYDEALRPEVGHWAFSAVHVLATSTLFCVVAATRQRRVRPIAILLSLAFVLGFWATEVWSRSGQSKLPFRIGRAEIEMTLLRHEKTEHFRLFADPSFKGDTLVEFLADLEYTHQSLVTRLGVEPEEPTSVYVYRSSAQKGELMGASRTQVAKPWLSEIHIQGMQVPHPVLQHELAHIYTGALSGGLLKVPTFGGLLPKMGLIEGIAVAVEDDADELSLSEWSAAMRKLGRLPKIQSIISPFGFYRHASSVAYTAAGGFFAFLFEEFGADKVGELYGGASFEKTFGQPLAALEAQWHRALDKVALDELQLEVAKHRFERPSIWNKVCGRTMANLSKEAERYLRAGNYTEAKVRYEKVVALQPAQIYPLIRLGKAALLEGELDEAERMLTRAQNEQRATTVNRARATEALADVRWAQGRNEEAQTLLTEVLEKRLSTPSARAQWARLVALGTPKNVQELLRDYLTGNLRGEKATLQLLHAFEKHEHPLVGYLLVRRILHAQPELIPELALFSKLPPLLQEAGAIFLGRSHWKLGQRSKALDLLTKTATTASSALHRAEALRWRQRVLHYPEAQP